MEIDNEIDQIRNSYTNTFGSVPLGIETRLQLAQNHNRQLAIIAIENLRKELLRNNSLEPRVQQLVHYGQLLSLGHAEPARLHAKGVLKAGGTVKDLLGVAETALITSGMPAYSLGITICSELEDL